MFEQRLRNIQAALDYQFGDTGFLIQALTHRSANANHNERMEFVGDAVLQLCITESLYRLFPNLNEGDLSRMRAALVSRSALVEVASDLGLARYLEMGSGELNSGGQQRDSTLADACEAVIGAIFLDAGFETASRVIEQLFGPRIQALPSAEQLKDPKTRLQEFLQSGGLALPVYELESSEGPPHARHFTARCTAETLGGKKQYVRGIGSSRRKAEQAAAEAMLKAMAAS